MDFFTRALEDTLTQYFCLQKTESPENLLLDINVKSANHQMYVRMCSFINSLTDYSPALYN